MTEDCPENELSTSFLTIIYKKLPNFVMLPIPAYLCVNNKIANMSIELNNYD
jgi:hypothetical protein